MKGIAALSIIGGFLATVLVGPALGGEPRTHDGLFLRLSGGGGSAQTEFDLPGGKTELSGGTGDLNFAIGAVVTPNLALHGTLFGWLVSDPDEESELGSGTAEGDLDMTAFGAGVTYYFMPGNIYISGSAGAGKLSFDDHDPLDNQGGPSESDTGFIGEVSVGKEWWLGGSWGLGIAGAFGFHSIPDGDFDENWTGTSFALRLSATLN